MALIAYLRSAKNKEGRQCNAQRDAIATTLGPIDRTYSDVGASGNTTNAGLAGAIKSLATGDVLAVERWDRLGRSTLLYQHIVNEITQRGATAAAASETKRIN